MSRGRARFWDRKKETTTKYTKTTKKTNDDAGVAASPTIRGRQQQQQQQAAAAAPLPPQQLQAPVHTVASRVEHHYNKMVELAHKILLHAEEKEDDHQIDLARQLFELAANGQDDIHDLVSGLRT